MSQINNLKYYNKVTCALKWARKLPRKTETYESAKCVPCNTRKCTHNGFVSDILKCKFYATGPWSQVSWFDGEVCCKSVIWVKVSKNTGVLRVLTQLQRFRLSWGISFLFPLSLFLLFFVFSQLFFVGYSSRFLVPISKALFFIFKREPITILPWSCIGGPYSRKLTLLRLYY